MKRQIQIVLVIVFFLGISACSPVTPVAPPSEPASANGYHPLTTRTGVDEIDTILDAVASGDDQQVRSLIQFTSAECTRAEGLGGPPKCLEGEAEGTTVEVLPFMGPEGSFLRKDEIGNWQGIDATGLYAVYEVSPAVIFEQYYPAGKYAIMLMGKEGQSPVVLRVENGRVVRVDYLPDSSLASLRAMLEREAGTVTLPPVEQ